MYFIGLDVHKKKISYCVKDAAGRVHQEGKIGSTRREIRNRRRTLRYRNLLIRQMVQMKNRVSGLLMETGVSYNKQRLQEPVSNWTRSVAACVRLPLYLARHLANEPSSCAADITSSIVLTSNLKLILGIEASGSTSNRMTA